MTPLRAAEGLRVDLLKRHPAVKEGALVAHLLRMDPVTVLAERDPWARALRLASAIVISEAQNKK